MADNLRQELVDKVRARFAAITIANGYRTDSGAGLMPDWYSTPLDESQLPALIVFDAIDTRLQDDPNSGAHPWALRVITNVVFGPAADNPATARQAIADIKQAIALDPRWDGLARRSEEISDELKLDKEGTRVAGAQVIFQIITSRRPFAA